MKDSSQLRPSEPALDGLELTAAPILMQDCSVLDILGELGRATTAYHEAPPERFETARQEYEEALRRFKASV